jgi:MFS family permease
VFLILLTFATESPRILVKQGKKREAKIALRKLRGGNVDGRNLEQEIVGIETQLAMEQEKKSGGLFRSLWSLFTTKRSFNRLCTACTAHLMQVWSGASSITVYAPQYFEILGIRDSQERLLYTAVIGIVKLAAATACAVFAVDRIGRRRSLITGVTVQLVCISYIAAVLSVVPELAEGESTPETRRVGISAIVSMYLCGAGYAFGWNSLSYIITSEIFPLQTRTVGTAVVMVVHYGSRYGLQKAVPLMLLEGSMRPLGTFWFFSGITLTGICWVWAWVPETANMQLEQAAYTLEEVDPKGVPWGDGHELRQR